MDTYILQRSSRKDKKYMLTDTLGHQPVHFGAAGYSDYTMHHDVLRKERYLLRHKNDPHRGINPGNLSRDILWSRSNIRDAIRHASAKNKIKIISKL